MAMCITVKGAGTKGTKSRSMYALLPSRIFSHNGRRTCQRDCTLPESLWKPRVRARLCRWGARVWDLICGFCDVCTYAHAHGQRRWRGARVNGPKTHLEKEWVSKESLVRAAGRQCGVTCATNACTAAVGRETNERAHFYRRETVRGGLKARLDYCQITTRRSRSRWPRDLNDLYLVKVAYCQVANKAPLNLKPSIRRFLHVRHIRLPQTWNVTSKSQFPKHAY